MALEIDWFFQHVDWWHVLSIPVFTGVVGWLINWTGLIMLFGKKVLLPWMGQHVAEFAKFAFGDSGLFR